MSNDHAHGSSVATYIIVALVLGVITYIEFAIVEFDIAWLSTGWILFWLVLLSVAKFIMVILFFMHLKDDDNMYSGFFGSGMVFALGTFVVLAMLFTLPSTFRFLRAENAAVAAQDHAEPAAHGEPAHGEEDAIPEDLRALIDSDGYARDTARILDTPRPKDQRVVLRGPAISEEPAFSLAAPATLAAQATDGTAAEPPTDAAAAQDGAQGDDAAADEAAADDAAAQEDAAAEEPEGGAAAAPGDASWDVALGDEVYASNCAACHQANGAGVPGAFPPLAENMPALYRAEGGRTYLIDVLLYGLQGQIEVLGQTYNGVMPAWQQLSDEQIAAVLNHELTAWGNQDLLDAFEPIAADEVAAQRGQDLSSQDVHAQREALAAP